MKIQNRNLYLFTLITICIFLLTGCENDGANLLEPNSRETKNDINQDELNFVSLDLAQNELAKPGKPITISTKVTPKDGGQLKRILDGSKRKDKRFKDMWGEVTLDFQPQAVDKPKTVSFTLMRGFFMGFVNLKYSPHGLIFNKPAILNIKGYNLDLSNIDPDFVDDIKLYYTSQKNGVWIQMKCEEIFFDLATGTFRVVDGELPHFSRYAVAYSN